MTTVLDLHSKAMDLVDKAEAARSAGNPDKATKIYRRALDRELEAIELLRSLHPGKEPSWSVMHAGAASIALRAGEFRMAERLIGVGLAADAPDDVLDELRDLLDEVQYRRHLDLRGLQLGAAQFQVSLAGNAVGHGTTTPDIAQRKGESVRRMLERTAERQAKVPFRSDGMLTQAIRDALYVQFGGALAASYSFTVSVERRREQLVLPFEERNRRTRVPDPAEVVAEMFDCVRLVEQGLFDELRERIGDDDYYANFIGLARALAPDGNDVKTVGLTRGGRESPANVIAFRRRARSIRVPTPGPAGSKRVEIAGVLDSASGRMRRKGSDGLVVIVDDERIPHTLHVPKAILADLVRPRFGERVVVAAIDYRETLTFVDIIEESTTGAPGAKQPTPANR